MAEVIDNRGQSLQRESGWRELLGKEDWWAIWIGLAISSKVSEVRIAQQLGILASFPPLIVIGLISFLVINPTLMLAASLGGALLVIDCAAYLLVSKLFDRERLVTGTKPSSGMTGTAA